MEPAVPLAWPPASGDLPRTFTDRHELAVELQARFGQQPAAPDAEDAPPLSPMRGGRAAALAALAALDPVAYATSRNHLDGAVTRLSPYIRHGVLTLAEVRQAVFAALATRGLGRSAGEKLINELGWRDYWQRVWQQLGEGIWDDREQGASGLPPTAYRVDLPDDIAGGSTGLACIDAFRHQLVHEGWLHNHARMWLAAYLVHWRRVRWQTGARWFLRHLLDGDPASNNLSWQWVAGTFSAKPYLFNRANLERFSGGRFCRACPKAQAGGAGRPGGCPFEASYEQLGERLFRSEAPLSLPEPPLQDQTLPPAPTAGRSAAGPPEQPTVAPTGTLQRPVLWIHGEALGQANPAWRAHPGRPALFVFDRALIEGSAGQGPAISLKRLGFLYECLLDLPVVLRAGAVAEELLAFAAHHGADGVVTSRAVDPRFADLSATIGAALPLVVLEPEPFVQLEGPVDLRRFSRYWKRAERAVWAGFEGPRLTAA
ncbi:deoxyribodipyrimidine photolyase [Synechococcus sp. L2F]|uniref:FAD-binding domain-containing protein n=1 Tax=Synechococcus sp. L2F TaxID=2823739 RepID=UPI0037DA6AB9|nr:deoxyribodipyrimidine photolyase [Synechococcus sp. L2F]